MMAKFLLTVPGVLLLACAAFNFTSASTRSVVRGTAMYREQVRLPAGAVLEVTLEDVSLADAPSTKLGSVRFENPGSPPFEFEIPYDPETIDERSIYAVRATIRARGTLLFTTDTHYPVLTGGAGNEVELMLQWLGQGTGVPGHVQVSSPLGRFPATFEGELPCADCPGIFYHLDLFEDGVFFLRKTYLGRGTGAIVDTIGSWALAEGETRLALFSDPEAPRLFRVVDPETLRKLDADGRDIESSLNYDLRRKDAIGTIEPRLTMRGMYRYMADAALFRECLSGRRFQVAQEADNIALERAYLEAQRQPGEPLLVSLQGRIAERPAMEGDTMVLTVVPERFIGVWPGKTCGARKTTSELLNTRWKLTRLGDESIVLAENQREPYLVLASQDNRVSGFGGCNRFNGSYEIEGRSITFGPIASTKMACIPGGDTERAFLAALEMTTNFHKTAHHLELLDADGTIFARFEATELQ